MADGSDRMELRSILTSTRVGALSLTTRPTLEPTDTVADAAAEMRNASHGCAIVCRDGKIVGIFTERDLLRVIGGGGSLETPLSSAMTAQPRTVSVDDTLFSATRWMDQGGYRRLPVIDSSGAAVGIIDVKAIAQFLVEHFPAAVYNQASHAQSLAKNREGA